MKKRSIYRSLPSMLVAALLLCSAAVAVAAGASISSARSAPVGTIVTVKGVVSVPSGAFSPNDQGFAIQAGKHGIYIHDSLAQSLSVGQEVSVTGPVGNSFGLVWGVFPSSIQVTGSRPVHPAKPLKTGKVGEDTEGKLIRVTAVVQDAVQDDAPYGWKFHVDDGSGELTIFVYTGTNVDVSDIELGDTVMLTGFSGEFVDHYELNPRFQSDIVEL